MDCIPCGQCDQNVGRRSAVEGELVHRNIVKQEGRSAQAQLMQRFDTNANAR